MGVQSGWDSVKISVCITIVQFRLKSCAVVMKSGNLNFLEPSGEGGKCSQTTQLIRKDVIF